MFEIKYRDGCGRVCDWKFGKHKVKTPNIAIVINPDKQIISPKEIREIFGAEIIITNAYIIKKSKKAREIEEKGIHEVYDWDGPVYTDSGTFQMYSHGSVSIGPEETLEYQKKIGSDIITPLDMFTIPKDTREIAQDKLTLTIERLKQARELVSEKQLVGPVQGGRFIQLREDAARQVSLSRPDIFAIGGIVPLMERYDFKQLVNVVMAAKMNLSLNRPVHAFGCGHPMLFSLLVLMGVDLFDSAAYALYAQDKRYMTVNGTYSIKDMSELPCSCPACSGKTPSQMKVRDIAMHNLYVTFQEIKTIRQAIKDGRLFELAEQRVRSHPALLDAYLELLRNDDYVEFMEMFDPITKGSAFFYTGRESLRRPSVYRAKERISKRYFPPKGRKGYVLQKYERFIKSTRETHFMMLDNIYGIIPAELLNLYPFGQTIAPHNDFSGMVQERNEIADKYISSHRQDYESLNILSRYKDSKDMHDLSYGDADHMLELRSLLIYQYGKGAETILEGDISFEVSRKTGRLRRAYHGDSLLGTVRAEDGLFIPGEFGARRLYEALGKKSYSVVVSNDAVPFIKQGKSVFCKFVVDASDDIRPYDEVFIKDQQENLIGIGRCMLNRLEMLDFNDGVAVKTRIGLD